jgi:hypothetical protein
MRRARTSLTAVVVVLVVWQPACQHPFPHGVYLQGLEPTDVEGGGPPGLQSLARDIDSLEKHIEKYGSIVPKHADVWGQARLTMHRQEFEVQMKQRIDEFADTLQASIARSDQAFLASAVALQAAASSRRGPAPGLVPTQANTTNETRIVNTTAAKDQPGTTTTRTTGGTTTPEQPPQVQDPGQLLIDPEGAVTRTPVRPYTPIGFREAETKLALEPTLQLDQESRYIKHLHELRRVNEGDDNTDAPGYALNLVRLPVSILTGSRTDTGFGAECTVTITPYLTDDLLPTTFRNLVLNDLMDQFTMPITAIIDSSAEKTLQELAQVRAEVIAPPPSGRAGPNAAAAAQRVWEMRLAMRDVYGGLRQDFARQLHQEGARLSRPSGSPRRVSQLPVPPAQFLVVFGAEEVADIVGQIYISVKDHLIDKRHPYHLDVQAALAEELKGAYAFLAAEANAHLWQFAGPALVQAIRSRNDDLTIKTRCAFFEAIYQAQGSARPPSAEFSITAALAWAIVVESALLNERLLEDMRATHAAKGAPCVPEGGLPFYLPNPPPEARALFNDYVRCRWPVYVFAIDPTTEDQNVADAFSLRRELQLALSLAFTSGQIGARSLTRYTRRLEEEIETIALNRTVVGFSHGSDTFGWRFYPRVQTPPIAGNLQTIFRDLLVGSRGPGHELRYRRLENGPRECVALVVMPSFVPQVVLDVSANWFRLASPKHKELTLADAMRLSRSVQEIRGRVEHACDEHHYRPGDAALLLRRLEQLSVRLPLQSQLVNVPFENTHGGFELFASGTTDLAPELIGWYGGPGIHPDGVTSLFLVGNHFSVHQTRVVAGGVVLRSDLPALPGQTTAGDLQVELLSRQVMRITIPGGCQPKNGRIDVHVATPYGVSQSLAIPVVGAAAPPAAPAYGYSIPAHGRLARAGYQVVAVGDGTYKLVLDAGNLLEGGFRINWDEPTGSALKKVTARFLFRLPDGSLFPIQRTLTAQNGYFSVSGPDLQNFLNQLLDGLNTLGYTPDKLPPAALEATVEVEPISPRSDKDPPAPPDKEPTHAIKKLPLPTPVRVELQRFIAPPPMARPGGS